MAHVRLFNHYIHTPYLWLGVLEALLHACSAYLAVWLVQPLPVPGVEYADLSTRLVVYSAVMLFATLAMGVYQARLREGFLGMAVRTMVAYFLLGCVLLLVIYLMFPGLHPGRGTLAPALLISYLTMLLLRHAFVRIAGEERLRRSILLVGSGPKAQTLVEALEGELASKGLRLVGVVPCGDAETAVAEERLLRLPGSIYQFALQERVDEVVVVAEERRRRSDGATPLPINDLLDCKLAGINVLEAVTFYERETGKIEISLIHPAWLVFSDGFRFSSVRDISKRIFDLAVSIVLLLLVWPLMLCTALAVWLESGCRGPVLYRQERVGFGGRTFSLAKFRSMSVDAEKDGKAVWAQKNDSRITRVGAVIRSTRLDELPQLLNVIRGEMSFVGPRPERPQFVTELAEQIPFYDARHRVKPGLMGWAQLCYPYGASVDDARQKLKYDLYYVKNHSLLLDCLIVIQTVEVVLLGKGAH